MESTYNELFSESDMLFNLSPSLPIMSSWREWIILHFTQIIDTETFQITFPKTATLFCSLKYHFKRGCQGDSRHYTFFLSLKKNTLEVITGKKNSNFVLFLNILKNEVVLSRGRTRFTEFDHSLKNKEKSNLNFRIFIIEHFIAWKNSLHFATPPGLRNERRSSILMKRQYL